MDKCQRSSTIFSHMYAQNKQREPNSMFCINNLVSGTSTGAKIETPKYPVARLINNEEAMRRIRMSGAFSIATLSIANCIFVGNSLLRCQCPFLFSQNPRKHLHPETMIVRQVLRQSAMFLF